jgi:hypothetical protein
MTGPNSVNCQSLGRSSCIRRCRRDSRNGAGVSDRFRKILSARQHSPISLLGCAVDANLGPALAQDELRVGCLAINEP